MSSVFYSVKIVSVLFQIRTFLNDFIHFLKPIWFVNLFRTKICSFLRLGGSIWPTSHRSSNVRLLIEMRTSHAHLNASPSNTFLTHKKITNFYRNSVHRINIIDDRQFPALRWFAVFSNWLVSAAGRSHSPLFNF